MHIIIMYIRIYVVVVTAILMHIRKNMRAYVSVNHYVGLYMYMYAYTYIVATYLLWP